MKRFSVFCLGLLLVSIAIPSFSQEVSEPQNSEEPTIIACNFTLEGGLSWRNFRSVKFRNTTPSGYQGVFSRSAVDGMVEDYFQSFNAIGATHRDEAVIVYKDAGNGESKKEINAGDKFGPSIGLACQLWQKDSLSLAAVLGFQFYELYRSSEGIQGGETSTYQTLIPGLPAAPERDRHETNYLDSSAKTKLDMALYAFDFGLRFGFAPVDSFHIFFGIGPTLAVADMTSTNRYGVVRNADGAFLAGGKNTSNSCDWIFGLYASCGVEVMFTEQLGMSVEVRYDNAFDSADTKYTVQPLDSYGGMVKLTWRF